MFFSLEHSVAFLFPGKMQNIVDMYVLFKILLLLFHAGILGVWHYCYLPTALVGS